MPLLALILTYWLHLIATVTWIGGLVLLTVVVWPALIGQGGDDAPARAVLPIIERRFRLVANISLIVLIVTGLIQMGGDTHYEGFLQVNSAWTLGLLFKHVAVGGMALVSAVTQWIVAPAYERATLLARRGGAGADQAEAERTAARRQIRRLTALNLALGVVVLLCTAVITAL